MLSQYEADKINSLARHLDACIDEYGGIPRLPKNKYNQLCYLDICLLARLFNKLAEWEFYSEDIKKHDITKIINMYECLGNNTKNKIPKRLRNLLRKLINGN